jgi:hypothetical protein
MSKQAIEKIVDELSNQVPFKSQTELGDVVLVVTQQTDGSCSIAFAQIGDFKSEIVGRTEWWHVTMTFLTLPLSCCTFIVKEEHLNGREIFSSQGRQIFIKAVNTEQYLKLHLNPQTSPAPHITQEFNHQGRPSKPEAATTPKEAMALEVTKDSNGEGGGSVPQTQGSQPVLSTPDKINLAKPSLKLIK